jgi:RimJ/RimL family protein N-acetyltransferase
MSSFQLGTERLVLRELTASDANDLHQALGDPQSMRFYPHPFSSEEVLAWIRWSQRSYAENGHGLWGMVLRDTGELVGDCGLVVQDVDGERLVEVGYHVKPTHQRRGLASEAAGACRDHAFRNLGVDRLIALIRPENTPSRGVAERIGMLIWKSTLRRQIPHLVYAITRDAWTDWLDKAGSGV